MGQKKGGLFLPDQRCLGGAMVLNSTYNHMLHSTMPKAAAGAPAAERPTASQLSLHRSRKLAQSDSTTHNHDLNLHSLARRVHNIQNKPGNTNTTSYSQQQPYHQLAGRPTSAATAAEPRGWKAYAQSWTSAHGCLQRAQLQQHSMPVRAGAPHQLRQVPAAGTGAAAAAATAAQTAAAGHPRLTGSVSSSVRLLICSQRCSQCSCHKAGSMRLAPACCPACRPGCTRQPSCKTSWSAACTEQQTSACCASSTWLPAHWSTASCCARWRLRCCWSWTCSSSSVVGVTAGPIAVQ